MTNLKADVLIMTVTPVEARTVLNYVRQKYNRSCPSKPIDLITYYDLGNISGAYVVMARSGMGTAGIRGSGPTVLDAIDTIKPSFVIAVGIAFGINEKEQDIGDVLVSTQLLLYDLQRVGTDDQGYLKIVLRGDKPSASPLLIDRFEAGAIDWTEAKVHPGLILSGDKLIDSFDFRAQLLVFESEAVGGEMEGAGIYASSYRRKTDWIVIKAICDWGDGKKHEKKSERQKIAAHNATSFVFHVIEQGNLGSNIDSNKFDLDLFSLNLKAGQLAERVKAFKSNFVPHANSITAYEVVAKEIRSFVSEIMQWVEVNETHVIKIVLSVLSRELNELTNKAGDEISNSVAIDKSAQLDVVGQEPLDTLDRLTRLLENLQTALEDGEYAP